MKATLLAVSAILLAAGPVVMAEAPTAATAANPLVELDGMVELLKADGTAVRVRKITGMSSEILRVITDDGVVKIPLGTLHPQTLAVLDSMLETPEDQVARLQREAAAQEQYRQNQEAKDRMVAQDNAQSAAALRAEEARQAAARQAAAEAYARQQQYLLELRKKQDAQRAERKARLAERDRQDEAERQRQVQLQIAAMQLQAAQAQAQAQAGAQQAQAQAAARAAANPGPLAKMMTAPDRAATGVDKLPFHVQTNLKNWLSQPHSPFPLVQNGNEQLTVQEKTALHSWLDQWRIQRYAQNNSGGNGAIQTPVESWIEGGFTGFEPGRIFTLHNRQHWQQNDMRQQHFDQDISGRLVKVYIRSEGSYYYMRVEGAGEVMVKPMGY